MGEGRRRAARRPQRTQVRVSGGSRPAVGRARWLVGFLARRLLAARRIDLLEGVVGREARSFVGVQIGHLSSASTQNAASERAAPISPPTEI